MSTKASKSKKLKFSVVELHKIYRDDALANIVPSTKGGDNICYSLRNMSKLRFL